MPRKADVFNAFGKAPYEVVIQKEGKPDCVHHEIVKQISKSNLAGTCKKCGQVRLYLNRHKLFIDEKQDQKDVSSV